MPTSYNTVISVTNNLKTDLRDGRLAISKGSTSQNIPTLIAGGNTREIVVEGTDIENEIHGSEGTLSYLAQAGDADERIAFNFKCNNSEDNRVEMDCKKDDYFNVRIDPFAPNDRPLHASYTISKPGFVEDAVKPRGFDYSD
ncbi:uncharacterized protein TRUGW13939_08651 [Talaromyces rugulosus]|uniref:Uncharacterized protein n=1 Tax=Talaromyces rugulosus TaxID=121627 RepID=A0A7H8R566_TALRU|nr:uncharacterized protein TRUGW13939_08651 [Talaromyces rugulosus]QKX61500.1 hypothetical protein TRUGW13939_08651 [Talaromyces rugulosus]